MVQLKRTGGLGFLASQKKASIKLLIHKALAGWEEPRKHGTIHASDLFKDKEFCPREWAFLDMGLSKKKKEFIDTALKITFDHGRDLEWRLRNEWVRNYMVGYWRCGSCNHLHPTFGKAPKIKCPGCGRNHRWEYEEVRVLDKRSGVSGGLDGLMDLGGPKLTLLEIKTMAPDMHKKLVAPLAEHRTRTALYLKLLDASDEPYSNRVDTSAGKVLYASRSYGFKDDSIREAGIKDAPFSPLKEFDVQRDDSLFTTQINKATALTTWRNLSAEGNYAGMPCGVCVNGLCKRAQQCTSVGHCFSGHFPSTITWKEGGVPRHPGKTVVVGD